MSLPKAAKPWLAGGAGDNPAIAMLSVLGNSPPSTVVVNEMTTVASVWTHNQFIDGTAIKGHALGLKIAASNVPSFVNLQTGGWGPIIQDPLSSGQTPTMANFATLSDLLSGCATLVKPDACSKLFAAVTPPKGSAPTDTLTAAQAIARYPWYQPERSFRLLNEFYPVTAGRTMRPVPFMPYLSFPPSAWVLPWKFDGEDIAQAARQCSTAKATYGSETILRLATIIFGRATRPSSARTGNRYPQ
jgi:hypothetical protein